MKTGFERQSLRRTAKLLFGIYVFVNVVCCYAATVLQRLSFDIVVLTPDGQPVPHALVRWGPICRPDDQEQMVRVLADWASQTPAKAEYGILTPFAGHGFSEMPWDERDKQITTVDEIPGDVIGMTDCHGRLRFFKTIQQNPAWAFPTLGSFRFGDRALYVYDGESHKFRLADLYPHLPLSQGSVHAVLTLPAKRP
jgi:hypothetical protein